ncbi:MULTISPECIES: metal-dependent transcriptional regulator [Aeromicrobium]|uniref:metal-dependent transcriptional regulator n=1 Tax=Aeromicrobium TaxID=2040 RepID=UPI0006F49FE4|nr:MULTISPECIES: metal-dependent transcriptional regulator [Aeromicrobium]KQX75813.1 DtxR family transcriptional regulator [Aeromicrobium sp. Root472D3]MBD8606358.1 metal-dependent transcriptional regulator [Aeromicrobium sp. CFBP 8757]MCL8250648.1 metal-dependent transcriptional regulator [Aeromicrobium fastidiosum]
MANRRNVVAVEDCLKAIFSVGEWDASARTVGDIAARLRASTSSVSEMVRRLTDDGLVEHERYGNVDLTPAGLARALQMVRRHRLVETYLVTALDYGWDEVHDEAEVLEHAISDLMLDRMDRRLGHPWRDPHGDAIPTAAGVLHLPAARPLGELDEGASGVVARIDDEDPELLRWFADHGVVLDVGLTVTGLKPFGGATEVSIASTDKATPLDLGVQAVAALWVADAPPGVDATSTGCHYAACQHVGTPA